MASWQEAISSDRCKTPDGLGITHHEQRIKVGIFEDEGGTFSMLWERVGFAMDLSESQVTAGLLKIGVDPDSGWTL